MPINASKARSLCTESEYNLFKWSSEKMAKTLAPSQLKQKIDRARKLRNKYRDLAKQQRGEARGKRKPTGTRAAKGNERTVEKAQLFDEVLERFETAHKNAAAKAKKAGKTSTKKTSKKTAKKSPTKKKTTKTSAKKSVSKKTTAKKTVNQKTSAKPKKKKKQKKKIAHSVSKTAPKHSEPKRAGTTPTIPLVPGAVVTKPSLASGGHESPFSSLAGESGKSDIDARRTRRKQTSKAAKAGRIESRFARTVQEKIQGHISGQTKRNQARRDTKN